MRVSLAVARWASELSTLLGVGMPLADALATMCRSRQRRSRSTRMLLELQESLAQGHALAEAMSRQPGWFDGMSVALVEVGQETGQLEVVFGRLAAYQQRAIEMQGRLGTALIYPAFVAFMGLAVTVFLMTAVVPQLLLNLEQMGAAVPWPTRVLQQFSEFLTSHGGSLVGVLAGAGLAGRMASRSRWGWRMGSSLVLRIPVVGPLQVNRELSRILLVMSTLLASGVDLLRTLELCRRGSTNASIDEGLKRCHDAVGNGKELARTLAAERWVPELVLHSIAIGESSGELDVVLRRLADELDQQVTAATQRLVAILEPILIVGLAGAIGFVLMGTMLPVLEAGNVLDAP